MALPMVHLLAARGWAKQYPSLCDFPDFYLGAIAPDAIHARENADREAKRATHLHTTQANMREPVLAFFRVCKAEHGALTPFEAGYGIHVLTDRVWARFYKEACPGLIDAQGKTISALYYNDTDQVDFLLHHQSDETPLLWDMLRRAAPPSDFPLLSHEEIDAWRNRILRYFDTGASGWRDPVRHLTYERIQGFLCDAPALISALLEGNAPLME